VVGAQPKGAVAYDCVETVASAVLALMAAWKD
jgi:hypothetical protein